MSWKPQIDDHGVIARYKDSDTNESITAREYERRMQMQTTMGSPMAGMSTGAPSMYQPINYGTGVYPTNNQMQAMQMQGQMQGMAPGQQGIGIATAPGAPGAVSGIYPAGSPYAQQQPYAPASPMAAQPMGAAMASGGANPLIQQGAKIVAPNAGAPDLLAASAAAPLTNPGAAPAPAAGLSGLGGSPLSNPTVGLSPTAGQTMQGKSLRMEGTPGHSASTSSSNGRNHGFLDATSIAILLPTMVLLALIIAAAHKKRLFPWQTIRTFNPPSGLMNPRDYERSYLCPPNLRRHGRLGKRNPNQTWTEADGTVLPFGFLARTHLPVTIPMGRLPNKNMFIVAPSGSGKTTLMRAVIKALLAKPCVIIALEAKANDPNLDERKEGFKYSLLPEAEHAGFDTLYFNPLDANSIHWNPMDLDPISFASSIVQDVNSLPPEEQHWAERDHGYIYGLAQLLKWGAIQVASEDENGQAAEVTPLPCNPRGLMRLVNNRRNIVESLRRLKSNPNVDASELLEMTQTLSSIIRTDTDWDKNIQGVRGRLRMFKNAGILRVTETSNIDIKQSMHHPSVLIFGAPASLGPDAESLASCFVYQLQQALHTRYGTNSILPLFAFFDEYQTLNIDLAGRLSAIVRGANGGLTVILQNISQITGGAGSAKDPAGGGGGGSEIKTIFSNSAVRVCLHNADETTAQFFSAEIGKHAVVVPGISDHYMATGFGIFPTSWNRIHSQQVVARVDADSIKRMEKHHALVYLAPAGDPEFGEVKPLMVDLRGIEEIARLHLLHNVTARKQAGSLSASSDEAQVPAAQEAATAENLAQGPITTQDFATPAQMVNGVATAFTAPVRKPQAPPSFAVPPQPVSAQAQQASAQLGANGGRTCPNCNKVAGKGKFCIECGRFIGPALAAAASSAVVELATSAQVIEGLGQVAFAPNVAVPGAVPAVAVPAAAVASAAVAAAAPQAVPTFAAPGADIAQRAAAARKPSLFESPAQIAEAAQQALGGSPYSSSAAPQSVLQGAQRQPVTSFNLDPSRLGYTPQGQGRKEGKGVEF